MIAMIAVALRRQIPILHLRANGVGRRRRARMVLVILLQELFLSGLRECVDGIARLAFTRSLRHRDAITDRQNAFGANEAETGILRAAVDEIHAQRQVEGWVTRGLRII